MPIICFINTYNDVSFGLPQVSIPTLFITEKISIPTFTRIKSPPMGANTTSN